MCGRLQDFSEKLYKQNYYATAAVRVRLKYIQAPKSEEKGAKKESYVFPHLSSPPESPIKQYKSQPYWADFMATRWQGLLVH